jgi:hypothetical protein
MGSGLAMSAEIEEAVMLGLFCEEALKCAARLPRGMAIAATALTLSGAARAGVIFDNITGANSPGGFVVGEYSPGADYAIGSSFTVPLGEARPMLGGSIGVSFKAGSGLNQMDLQIAEDVGDTVGATVAWLNTFTRIPRGANSTARVLPREMTAALVAE